uniref:THAP-type domain-containing protein n=1 Tax=Monopterus albus TaxID=43700 RepID=A0A3Q3K9Q6_MONAL
IPKSCAAWGCFKRSFHKFPKDKGLQKQWETALIRERFSASSSTVLCSEHFRQEDFDRTGQTVRIRKGVILSVFCFPAHLQKVRSTRL